MCKTRTYLEIVGDLEAKRVINRVHAQQLAVSPTARKELEAQLKKTTAGIRSHLHSCTKCTAAIEIVANRIMQSTPHALISASANVAI